MKNEDRIRCSRCGSGSFRYRIKEKASYCMACGKVISEADWEAHKKKVV